MLGWIFRVKDQVKLEQIQKQISDINEELRKQRDKLTELDIKVLENRRVYHKKLMNLDKEIEKPEEEKTKSFYSGVLLPE